MWISDSSIVKGPGIVTYCNIFTLLSCNKPMAECARSDVKDGVGWRCMTCKVKRISIREGSFFSKNHLTLQQWMMLIHYWARQHPVCGAAESSGIGKNTAIDVYQWLCEVCSTRLINDGPIRLGGLGVIVQIDESLFRHKQKVIVYIRCRFRGLLNM